MKSLDVDALGLTEHVLKENDSVDWTKATVIGVQSKCLQRQLLQSWYIGNECTKAMNRQVGPLPILYCGLSPN